MTARTGLNPPASENLGAEELYRVSAALEKAIKEGERDTLEDRIAELLESDLTEAMNRLGILGKHLANSGLWEEFQQLEKHVEGFDTDSALKSIESIARSLDIPL